MRVDRVPLVPQIVGDRLGETRVGELMRRIGERRAIAARELVLSLRAGLDPPQAAVKREVDRLIIADLEMKERPVLDRAPVAAVERVVADEIDGAGDVAARAPAITRRMRSASVAPIRSKKARVR